MNAAEFNKLIQFRYPGIAAPVPIICNIENDSDGDPVYIGYAKQGSADADAAWIIEKLTYDSSGYLTGTRVSQKDQVWNSRAGLYYT